MNIEICLLVVAASCLLILIYKKAAELYENIWGRDI